MKNPLGLPATGSVTVCTAGCEVASIWVRISQFFISVENSKELA